MKNIRLCFLCIILALFLKELFALRKAPTTTTKKPNPTTKSTKTTTKPVPTTTKTSKAVPTTTTTKRAVTTGSPITTAKPTTVLAITSTSKPSLTSVLGTNNPTTGSFGIGSSETLFDSTIIKNVTQLVNLVEFSQSDNLVLLYRASRDGFSASDFHQKCDYKTSTLVIIRSASGNVFGGYTEASWDGDWYKQDPAAFLFSLTNKENSPVKLKQKENNQYSIMAWPNSGPRFGNGHDIFIISDSNTNTNSYSNLGRSYVHSAYAEGSNEAKSFLAGSYQFQTAEIEVYQKVLSVSGPTQTVLATSTTTTSLPSIFPGSTILNRTQAIDLRNLCGFYDNTVFSLIYKATRDGFGAPEFHQKCGHTNPTLVIVKVGSYIFGGYTGYTSWWRSPGYGWSWNSDKNAFMFSLINMYNVSVKFDQSGVLAPYYSYLTSIRVNYDYGPVFGEGPDLEIASNSNVNNYSRSMLGYRYGRWRSDDFLAGSKYFQTDEIEIFKVN